MANRRSPLPLPVCTGSPPPLFVPTAPLVSPLVHFGGSFSRSLRCPPSPTVIVAVAPLSEESEQGEGRQCRKGQSVHVILQPVSSSSGNLRNPISSSCSPLRPRPLQPPQHQLSSLSPSSSCPPLAPVFPWPSGPLPYSPHWACHLGFPLLVSGFLLPLLLPSVSFRLFFASVFVMFGRTESLYLVQQGRTQAFCSADLCSDPLGPNRERDGGGGEAVC